MSYQDSLLINQCHCKKPRNDYKYNIPSTNFQGSCAVENEYGNCGCPRTDTLKPVYQQIRQPQLDRQTLNALSYLRQKACRFINSESEVTSSTSEDNIIIRTCRNGDCKTDRNALQKAQDMINYVPESEFLKKMKGQSQYFPNCGMQNGFPTFNQGSDFAPYVCDNCVARSKQILKLSEELNTGRTKYSPSDSKNNNKSFRSIFTDQQSKTSGLDFIEKTCRTAVNEYQRNLGNSGTIRDDNDLCATEDRNAMQPSNKSKEKTSTKKSQHVSRSKKPRKSFHRRKRKSNDDSGKSQENFEPSLKKPNENSCERCWRYASPPRSPVNKPDQKYDPNFRRAHSAIDVTINDEQGKSDDDDDEENTREKPSVKAKETIRPRTPAPDQYSANTKVKDLMYEPLQSPVSDRNYQRTQNVGDSRASKAPENRGIIYSKQKLRPKSSIPASRARGRDDSFELDDFDATEYKDIVVSSKRQDQNGTDCRNKYTRNTGPVPSSSGEHLEHGAYERSRSSPKYGSDAKGYRSYGGANQTSHRNGNLQTEPNFAPQSTYRETTRPHNTGGSRHRPASSYAQASKGNQPPLMNQHTPYCRGKEEPDWDPSSHHFHCVHPGRTRSSVIVQEHSPRYEEQKPRSAGVGMAFCNCRYYQNLNTDFEVDVNQGRLPPHPFKPCNCRFQETQAEMTEYHMPNCAENNLCCHCRGLENSRVKSNRPNGRRRESQDNCSHYEPSANPDVRLYDIHISNNPKRNHRNSPPFRNGITDSDFQQGHSGKTIPCPYRQYISNNAHLRNHNRMNCFESREDENYPSIEDENFRNRGSNDSNQSPKKYCVFYMTKNKDDTGNDVEVLIEELTQRRSRGAKGSKGKSLKEKMKRLMDCQSDSMALRFQKGVSEAGKNLQSSRVVYF